MRDQALDISCSDCGDPLSLELHGERAVRCASCFEHYLRGIDADFLQSYAKLGVTARRTVAETCLRGLVLESPPARKILAMTIWEQFILASTDLVGLSWSIRNRQETPIVQSFLSFRLDHERSSEFFDAITAGDDTALLGELGLPAATIVSQRYPALPGADARELGRSIDALLRDLRTTAQRSASALLLSELSGRPMGGPALTGEASWLDQPDISNPRQGSGWRPDHVASLVLDQRRRQLVLHAVPIDEDRLGDVVDAIDCMTRASSNLIYAYLTVQDEEARTKAVAERT
jgi:LSD1 subclass zinc finger protein